MRFKAESDSRSSVTPTTHVGAHQRMRPLAPLAGPLLVSVLLAHPGLMRAAANPTPSVQSPVQGSPDKPASLELSEAMRQLKSPEPLKQLRALQALGSLGDVKAWRPILELLETSRSEEVKRACLTALEKLHYTPSFLLEALQNPEEPSRARAHAAFTLGQMQSIDAVPALIAALQSPDEIVRSRAIDALGRIKDPRAWKPLIVAANKDASPELRKKAQKTVENLTAMGGDRGLDAETLATQLKDPNPVKRREAAQALSTKGNWWSIKPLSDALRDPDSETRRFAARALGDLQDRRAVEPLIQFLPRSKGLERYTALAALGVLKDESAFDALVGCLQDSDAETRRYAARSIGTIGASATKSTGLLVSASVGQALAAGLNDLVPANRREVARSLGLLRYPGAVSGLARLIKEDVEENQIEATRALGRIGGLDALGPLLKTCAHENPMVVVAAVIAIKETGLQEGLPTLEQLARRHKDPLVKQEALQALTELKAMPARQELPPVPTHE